MSNVDVTIIDPVISDSRKRKLATRLSNAVVSFGQELGDRRQWLMIAKSVQPTRAADPETTQPTASTGRRAMILDFAAWHAHLTGTRSWAPGELGTTA